MTWIPVPPGAPVAARAESTGEPASEFAPTSELSAIVPLIIDVFCVRPESVYDLAHGVGQGRALFV
ncbi:hypothetical protein [Brevibacterium aurantiacum]|uniref:hypothetical protein n=1 Tax=Brevibacterium aurantiacum TaxID=273384 RepID=UPI000F0A6614|nr:hypothetical protein [Brevibacterium aurantiacum]